MIVFFYRREFHLHFKIVLNKAGAQNEDPHHLSVPTPREKPAREGYFAGTSSVDVGPV
jgi:hypothetical protein